MIIIEKNQQCCGCSSCEQKCPQKCIRMIEDEQGFLYPYVNEKECIKCGLCKKVCPMINPCKLHDPIASYAAWHDDEQIRNTSSSGGVFTALAERIIDVGGVVFGARFNDDWEVIHDYTETIYGLKAFRGSKYVQSKIGDSYIKAESFLKQNRKVLFTGTPCQIAGLKSYLHKDYNNLLSVEVICHGAPSPLVWRDYIRYINNIYSKETTLHSKNVIIQLYVRN